MKIDLEILFHQIARQLAYLWALLRPDDYRIHLTIRDVDYPEIERFEMPEGKIIRVTIEFVNEEETE